MRKALDLRIRFFSETHCRKHPLNVTTALPLKTRWMYLTTWMPFDLLLIGFDYMFISFDLGDTNLAVVRSARILRVLRMIRLIKLSKLNNLIEESAAAAGRQWVTMVVAITKTGVGMILVAHWLTCFWYWTGMFLVDTSIPNWIEENEASLVAGEGSQHRCDILQVAFDVCVLPWNHPTVTFWQTVTSRLMLRLAYYTVLFFHS